jgi:hypothetical protein
MAVTDESGGFNETVPHFGNAGEIDHLLNKAKLSHQQRLSAGTASPTASIFVPEDFDADYDRGQKAEMNIAGLFAGSVGCEKIIAQMEGYCQTVKGMKVLDLDPREQVPFNFLFRGPPGIFHCQCKYHRVKNSFQCS